MNIAILSDIHDRIDNLAIALKRANVAECKALFFLGDICAPFALEALAKGFSHPIHLVLGNNDGDILLLGRLEHNHSHLHILGNFGEITVDGLKFAFTHYPNIANAVATSGQYKAVFYGHTHVADINPLENGTLLANPGEIMGRFKKPSFGIYNTETEEFTIIPL